MGVEVIENKITFKDRVYNFVKVCGRVMINTSPVIAWFTFIQYFNVGIFLRVIIIIGLIGWVIKAVKDESIFR